MSNEMVTQLLRADEHKAEMLHALGRAHDNFVSVKEEYRQAWRAATGVGWAKADLVRAGFLSPERLPRVNNPQRRRSRRGEAPAPQED